VSGPTGRRAVFCCEFCGTALIKRTSSLQHKYLRNDMYVCDNPLCGATFSGHSELTGVASPTGVPDAIASELPPTPSFLRSQLHQQWKADRGIDQLDLLDAIEAASTEPTLNIAP